MIGANQARHAAVDETIAKTSVILFIMVQLLPTDHLCRLCEPVTVWGSLLVSAPSPGCREPRRSARIVLVGCAREGNGAVESYTEQVSR